MIIKKTENQKRFKKWAIFSLTKFQNFFQIKK
jgi:hypothetical protein